MRNRTYRVLPLFVIAFLLLSGANAPLTAPAAAHSAAPAVAAAPTNATLSGQIRDAATLLGVRGRLLFLTSPVPINPVDTDANGNYTVDLPDGGYIIEYISGRCLFAVDWTVRIDPGVNQTHNVDLNRTLDTLQYGYSCDDQATFNWIPGTSGQLFNDQQVGVNLPFAFNYYGLPITNTTVWVTPAGYATLGYRYDPYRDTHVQIPDTEQPNNALYPYWDQFVTSTRGAVYTATVGTAPNRKFVIEWRDMVLFTDDPQNPSPLNFELVFYEGGAGGQPGTLLDMQYLAVGNNTSGQGRTATVGIENDNGTGALPYLFDEVALANNTTIHIYQPPLGYLIGHVTDYYSHQPLRAKVCAAGTELCKSSDAVTGIYTMTLIEAPYNNLQATASRHVTETRSITITRGQTTTADFALNSAHVVYNPAAVTFAIGPNQVATSTLVLDNIGTGVLQYRLREALGPEPVGCGPTAAAPEGAYIIDEQRTIPHTADNSTQSGGTDQIGHYRYVVNNPSAISVPPANILLYADDNFHGSAITTTYPAQALALLGWPYTGYYNDPAGFIAQLNAPPAGGWNLVIVANDRNSSLQNNFEALRTYMDSGPNARLVFQTYKYETTIPTTLFDRLGITQPITDSSDLIIPKLVTPWEPTEFIFRCPISLPNSLQMYAPPFPGYQDYGDTLTANSIGLEWGGYTIDPTPGQGGIVARDDGRSVSAGFIVSTLIDDKNLNGKDDGIDLFENMIKYVGNPPIPWGDIPWLSESPLNGTVGAVTPFSATLTFNTAGLAPGTYTGYLFGLSNDPNAVRREIVVTLTVCASGACGGDLAVTDVTLRGYGTQRPVAGQPNQVWVTVKNVGVGPMTFPNNYLYVDLYPDPNPSPPTSSTSTPYFGVIPGQTLNPGQTTVVAITWTPPAAGDHQLWAWVNRECLPQIGEDGCTGNNTGNNNLAGPISGCVFAADGYSFNDARASNTFYTYIERLYCVGAISGYPCGGPFEACGPPSNPDNRPYFRIGNSATRGQFTKILSAALGWSDPASGQTFQDVPPTQTFYTYIQRAAARGLISGYLCGQNAFEPCVGPANRPYFRMNNNITRAQISKVVVLAKAWITGTPTPVPTAAPYTFQDVPPNNSFYLYVEQAAVHGAIGGYLCGGVGEPCVAPNNRNYFRPNFNATRGQLSKIIVISTSQP